MENTTPQRDFDTGILSCASNEIPTCKPCQNDGFCHDAVSYCKDCEEYLCEECTKHHCRPKPCKNHVIARITKEEKPTDETDAPPLPPRGSYVGKLESSAGSESPPLPPRRNNQSRSYKNYEIIYCPEHPMEMISYICELHKKRMCHRCVARKHKDCKHVEYLPDVIGEKREALDFELRYIDEKRTVQISNLQECLQNTKASYRNAKHAIDEHRLSVMKYFKNVENTLETRMKNIEDDIEKKIKELSELESSVYIVDRSLAELDTLDKLNTARTEISDLSKQVGDVYLHFKEQHKVVLYSPTKTLTDLGKLHYTTNQPIETFSKIKTIDGSPEGVKGGGSLKGSTLLPNGNLVFADYRNKSLVLVDVHNDRGSAFHPCADAPMEVAHIERCKIAVLFPYAHRIQFFNVTDRFSIARDCDIELKDECFGMKYDYINRHLVLLSKCIKFVDLKGNTTKEISLKSDNVLPNHLAIVPGKHIYYSDVSRHSVTCLGYDGRVIKEFRYLDWNLKGPYGLLVDMDDTLYICGAWMLICVTTDDKWQTLIPPKEECCPQTVAICEERGLMFLGQAKTNSCDILVYKIDKRQNSVAVD